MQNIFTEQANNKYPILKNSMLFAAREICSIGNIRPFSDTENLFSHIK